MRERFPFDPPRFTDGEIESVARHLVRRRIERAGWYPRLAEPDRKRLIRRDVDQHWTVLIPEAMRCLDELPF
ncbi:hypothetical protein [Salinarimonas soli]|uniref:Uncharacterized protein n=1 Tax=Salinarimonas soli TaxID=1638099 RepID=A0A5B2V9Q5_9HYPH|nr:hypothetical protein [Salinarimonas soli]KAA2235576.1 hypothetical protein F0L46_18925 [Salinarimonas soli]